MMAKFTFPNHKEVCVNADAVAWIVTRDSGTAIHFTSDDEGLHVTEAIDHVRDELDAAMR